MNSAPMFHLQLLGGASLNRGDGAPVTGRAAQRHRLALLALLALAAAHRLSRDKLIGYLWPEADSESARNLLNVSTYVLRAALGDAALESVGDELQLNAAVARSDVGEFDAALERTEYERAVALYRGPFLDGFFLPQAADFEHWVHRERERLAGSYGKALEALAKAAEDERDFAKAAEWWRARAAHDVYDSRVALRLMQALDASGNPALALQHAASHERLLHEEFGIAPAPELQALAERLRSHTPSVRPLPTSPLKEPPLGTARVDRESGAPAEPTPALSSPTISGAEPAAGARPRSKAIWMTAAALLAVVALVGAAWSVRARESVAERSIVVLPFVNDGSDPDNDYFSDGLSEEIITRLSAVAPLKVISQGSAAHYKGTHKSLRQIANELKVTTVLQGTVRQNGERLRISTQLVGARSGEHVWAKSYDYDQRDAFRAQGEIARDVARALGVDLSERDLMKLGRLKTRDPQAYELYRRGRFYWSQRTKQGHEQAMEYFRRAIERDSTYADAYAAMAGVYLTSYQFGFATIAEAETYSRLKWAAEHALALDDESSDAHASFAVALWWQRDWPGAERELRRAIALNPRGEGTARSWLSLLLVGLGRPDEGLREMRRVYEIDPFFSTTAHYTYSYECRIARDNDCAIEQALKAIEIDSSWVPAYRGLALIYSTRGLTDQAIRAGLKAVQLDPKNTGAMADLAYAQARGGKRRDALANLQRAKRNPWEGFDIARAYIALDETDSAFAWLDRSSWRWPHRAARADPTLDPVRSDPRFAKLVMRVDREMGIKP